MIGFNFDGKTYEAQMIASQQAARMVTVISNETQAAIRLLVTRSIREGITPIKVAREIRAMLTIGSAQALEAAQGIHDMVGLTTRQASAARNFRASLIEEGLSSKRVAELSDRYIKKKIRERALNIARTETMNALNKGVQTSWEQAQERGFLSKNVRKQFIVTPDERLCDICAPMDGQTVLLKGSFNTEEKVIRNFSTPTIHPSCRCTMGIVYETANVK